jgi:tRNA G18 (ribose-2'-O)-methylase SpoU
MADIRKLSTKEIYEINKKRMVPDYLNRTKVILHNIRSMYNVGSVFRSADAFGIGELILTGYTPYPPRPEISKTALGAEEHVNWSQYDHFESAGKILKSKNYTFIGIEQTNQSHSLIDYVIDHSQPVAFILGNEVTGIDEDILPSIDEFIDIPQYGEKHSLNVSVTAGIVMFSLLEKYLSIQ